MILKIKKLVDNAVIPYKAHKIDAGFDMTAVSINVVDESDYGYIEYGTGIAVQIPIGYIGLLFPRSSVSKTGLILANSVGLVDPGYIDEVKFRFKYIPDTKAYQVGDRIGQLVIIKNEEVVFEETDHLEQFERSGGFGSTGS